MSVLLSELARISHFELADSVVVFFVRVPPHPKYTTVKVSDLESAPGH